MAKIESESFLTKTRKQRSVKKQKNHRKGFNEGQDFQATRHQRIGFKRYVEELEFEEMDYMEDEDIDESAE